MPPPVERTLQWRESKCEEGYRPLTIWLKTDVKAAMVDLAYRRHQDLGEMLTGAFLAWRPAAAVKPAVPTDLRALVHAEVIAQFQRQGLPLAAPEPPPTREALPEPPPGKKWCKGKSGPHLYAATRRQCDECNRLQKQQVKARQAAARRSA